MNLIAIQAEQIEWSERNFGKQHARYPLLGMIEELLEFEEAWQTRRALVQDDTDRTTAVDDVVDAIGDIAIYMLDYCGKVNWQLDHLWVLRRTLPDTDPEKWSYLVPLARRLAHHHLKGEQGIRGTPEQHMLAIGDTCRAILAHLELISKYLNKDFLEILDGVWSKVRKRDWTKNKANAHEVAEQQPAALLAKSVDP